MNKEFRKVKIISKNVLESIVYYSGFNPLYKKILGKNVITRKNAYYQDFKSLDSMRLMLESAIGLSFQINLWTTLAIFYFYFTSNPSATASAKFSSTILAQWSQMVAW